MIQFTVFGEPVAQSRPKFARFGNHVTAYDPAKSKDYKSRVLAAALEVRPEKPLDIPLSVTIMAYRSIPKSMSKKKVAQAIAGDLRPTTKPDASNICKGVEDALKGVIWRDDSQVVELIIRKWYSDTPRVEVSVKEIV
jgi:Holliday junction resolvase RusA-like endonuclease